MICQDSDRGKRCPACRQGIARSIRLDSGRPPYYRELAQLLTGHGTSRTDGLTPVCRYLTIFESSGVSRVSRPSNPHFGMPLATRPDGSGDASEARSSIPISAAPHNVAPAWQPEQATTCRPKARPPGLFRKLGAQHVHPLDHRRRCKEVRSLCHQSLGDGAVEMILPSCLIFECVKYSKRGRSQSHGEPHRRRPFLIRELEALLQEGGDLIFLPGFCLQADKQSNRSHFKSPWSEDSLNSRLGLKSFF